MTKEDFTEFTEEELKKIEADISIGSAFGCFTVERLVKALRLWNERAQHARTEGYTAWSGVSDAAVMLEEAGVKWKDRAEKAELQLEEWRKVGAALRDDIKESLAVEGLEASDTPKSHYSTAFNRLLELLAEKRDSVPGICAERGPDGICGQSLPCRFHDKRVCEHVFIDYQCEKCGVGDPQKRRIES